MVFAPHPDDETLGCGGTILRKRRLGAELRIVFMTDGAGSHCDLLPRAELSAMRAREAREVAEALGVEWSHVSWLAFPDGALEGHRLEAVSRVEELLERHRPEQLFLPYARGEHLDHVATHAIVHEAARRAGRRMTLLEYPVWLWRHWPACGWGRTWVDRRSILAGSVSTGFGLRLFSELRASVGIREVLGEKRAALARHVSQMRRRNGEPDWWILEDIDDGDFLACFFHEHELYRRVELPG
jgi:LmbE family N-acetylglucosaminyl deacetylase